MYIFQRPKAEGEYSYPWDKYIHIYNFYTIVYHIFHTGALKIFTYVPCSGEDYGNEEGDYGYSPC